MDTWEAPKPSHTLSDGNTSGFHRLGLINKATSSGAFNWAGTGLIDEATSNVVHWAVTGLLDGETSSAIS